MAMKDSHKYGYERLPQPVAVAIFVAVAMKEKCKNT